MHLLREVEKFLRRSNMPPSRFGRLAVGDPRFVGDLRNGREPGERTKQRAMAFIAEQDAQNVSTS